MSNKRDLKAFVRFDGSGRIVAGSLILRKKKPKVGKWHEIQAYECCNYIPTTTTTTTQGGSSTPTAWVAYTSFDASWSCQQINGLLTVLYSSASTLTSGVQLYTDAALTQPYNYFSGTFVAINNQVWEVTSVNGPIVNPQACSSITTTTTTTTAALFPVTVYYQGGSSTSNLCPPGSEGSGTVTLYSTTPTVQVGSIVYTSNSTSFPLTFGGFYYKQVGESLVFYAPADDGVAVAFNC